MRKIEREMIAAINAGRKFKQGNTEVQQLSGGDVNVLLHGNLIAKWWGGAWAFHLAGWNTPTTRSRVNALLYAFRLGGHVHTRKGQAYYNDSPIDNYEWF